MERLLLLLPAALLLVACPPQRQVPDGWAPDDDDAADDDDDDTPWDDDDTPWGDDDDIAPEEVWFAEAYGSSPEFECATGWEAYVSWEGWMSGSFFCGGPAQCEVWIEPSWIFFDGGQLTGTMTCEFAQTPIRGEAFGDLEGGWFEGFLFVEDVIGVAEFTINGYRDDLPDDPVGF